MSGKGHEASGDWLDRARGVGREGQAFQGGGEASGKRQEGAEGRTSNGRAVYFFPERFNMIRSILVRTDSCKQSSNIFSP